MSVFRELTVDADASVLQQADSVFAEDIRSVLARSAAVLGEDQTGRFELFPVETEGLGADETCPPNFHPSRAAEGAPSEKAAVHAGSVGAGQLDVLYLTNPLLDWTEDEAATGSSIEESAETPLNSLGRPQDAADLSAGDRPNGANSAGSETAALLIENVELDGLDQLAEDNFNLLYDPNSGTSGAVEILDASGKVTRTLPLAKLKNKRAPCFTPGTLITTNKGERLVEDLKVGDKVLTRDNGYQALIWIGRRVLSAEELEAAPQLKPVRIAAGALGYSLPDRDLTVSPQHRMLMARPRAEFLFGEQEVLIAAAHLVGQPGISRESPREGVTYIHLMLEQHEILRGNGAWSESYQPGALTIAGLDDGPRQELLTLFPELARSAHFPAARITLRKHEARLLMAE